MFRLFITIIGGVYFYIKSSGRENSFREIFIKEMDFNKANEYYYTGLKIFSILGAIVTILYIFYIKITNQEIS